MEMINALIEPISSKNAAGEYVDDHTIREYLDDEFMKIGTLQHGSLNWLDLEEKSIHFLSKECKDFKVLSYLMLCLQQDGNPERFLISLKALHQFSKKYWLKGHPRPGKAGEGIKKKLFLLMLNRSIKSSDHLSFLLSDMPLLEQYKLAINELEKIVKKHSLDIDGLTKITTAVTEGLASLDDGIEEEAGALKNESAKTSSASSSVGAGFEKINLTDERKIKDSYFKLANFTNDIDGKNPLGYQLRRFGLWQTITAIPPTGKNGCTEMMAVPKDRAFDYIDSIKNNATVDLLKRIEHTIETSPFWIQGSYLAAGCAEKLNMSDVALAIQQSTLRFLQRLPTLGDNKFSDGTDFLDDKTKQWLSNTDSKESDAKDDFEQLYTTKGLEATLNEINKQLTLIKEPRDSYHLKLLAAEFLKKSGMHSLAQSHFLSLEEEVRGMLVTDWEPIFLQRLSNNGGL